MNHIEHPHHPEKPRKSDPEIIANQGEAKVQTISDRVADAVDHALKLGQAIESEEAWKKMVDSAVDRFVDENDILISPDDVTGKENTGNNKKINDQGYAKNRKVILDEIKIYLLRTAKQMGWDEKMINLATEKVITDVEDYLIARKVITIRRLSKTMQTSVDSLYYSTPFKSKNGTPSSIPPQP